MGAQARSLSQLNLTSMRTLLKVSKEFFGMDLVGEMGE
jgi:hypothetical protein